MIVTSTTAGNHQSTMGISTNDLENDTWAYINLYTGHTVEASGLFGNSIDTGNIAANKSGSNYDHRVCIELPSNCDTRVVLVIKLVLIVTFIWVMMNV